MSSVALPLLQRNPPGIATRRLDSLAAARQPHPSSETYGAKDLETHSPAHTPVKRSTLSHILKQAEMGLDNFLKLL